MTHLPISPAAWPTDHPSFLGTCHRSATCYPQPPSTCPAVPSTQVFSPLSPLPTHAETESYSAFRLFLKALPKAHSLAASGAALTHHTGLFAGDLVPVSTE